MEVRADRQSSRLVMSSEGEGVARGFSVRRPERVAFARGVNAFHHKAAGRGREREPQEYVMSNVPHRPLRRRNAAAAARPSKRRTGKSASVAARAALELATLQEFRTILGSARRHDSDVRRIAGISGSQLWALSEIARADGLRVNDLSERMALHQTTASNLCNALVERNLVRRSRDEDDQRVVRLRVTTDGKKMLLRAPGPYTGLLVDALRHLKAPDLHRLNDALCVLTAVLRDTAGDAAGQTLTGE
jgi:DNA-binding MarR family transcriptional regulator